MANAGTPMCEDNNNEYNSINQRSSTVKEVLDEDIRQARARVERLCILKAKAEALNILEFDAKFINDLVFH